jgi:hypothetical protein
LLKVCESSLPGAAAAAAEAAPKASRKIFFSNIVSDNPK